MMVCSSVEEVDEHLSPNTHEVGCLSDNRLHLLGSSSYMSSDDIRYSLYTSAAVLLLLLVLMIWPIYLYMIG